VSRGVKLFKSSAIRVTQLFLSIAISFYMLPFLVGALGDRQYGLWTLVGTFLGYYGLMDLGLSSAVGRFLSRAIGQESRDELRKVASTTFYIFLAMAAATVLLTAVFALALEHVVSNKADVNLFRFLLIILGLNFAFDFPIRTFNAVFTSHIRDDIGIGITIVKTILTTICIVWAIKKGHGLVGLALVTVFFSVLDSLVRVILSYKVEPALSVHPRHFDRSKLGTLFSYSGYTFVGKLADILRFRLNQLIITAYLSLSAVTHYFVAVRLVEYFSELMHNILKGVGPVFSQDEGKNDYEAIRRNFLFFTKISVFLSVYLGGTALLYGRVFILRWMGADYEDSAVVLLFLMTSMVVCLLQTPVNPLLYGISKHKFFTYSNLVEGVVNALLSLWLVRKYGMYGVAVGTAVPMVLMAVFVQPWYACRAIDLPLRHYASLLARAALCAAGFLLLAWLPTRWFMAADYAAIAGGVAVVTALYWPLVFFFGFPAEERRTLLGVVEKFVPLPKRLTEALG